MLIACILVFFVVKNLQTKRSPSTLTFFYPIVFKSGQYQGWQRKTSRQLQRTNSFYQNNIMYFIRLMLLWYTLVLSARCSGSDEIPLDRAEQSSTWGTRIAASAIDSNLATLSTTIDEDPAWWRVYFTRSSTVDRVVVEKGLSYDAACVLTVSVYDGVTETVCGTYTGKLFK